MNQFVEARKQFPQISEEIRGTKLVYLDSAATALKPSAVIERLDQYYSHEVANIHRAAHFLASAGTAHYEAVREQVRQFVGAQHVEEIVFTKGTTEGLNLLAQSLAAKFLNSGDEILLTEMEHHSNIVPWQLVAERFGFKIKYVPIDDNGELNQDEFQRLLSPRVKVFSAVHLSNVLGGVNPLEKMISMARASGAITVVDAAQSVALGLVNVQKLACDFLVFSGHKLYGPNGIGVLYGRREVFSELPPYQGGGSMIQTVDLKGSTYLGLPQRFEAGTPPIAEAIGLGAALEFISQFKSQDLLLHGQALVSQFLNGVKSLGDVKVYGRSGTRASLVAFNLSGVHASDLGQILDEQGIALRTGHHCCQPLMSRLGVSGTARVSFGIYNNEDDVTACLEGLAKAKRILS